MFVEYFVGSDLVDRVVESLGENEILIHSKHKTKQTTPDGHNYPQEVPVFSSFVPTFLDGLGFSFHWEHTLKVPPAVKYYWGQFVLLFRLSCLREVIHAGPQICGQRCRRQRRQVVRVSVLCGGWWTRLAAGMGSGVGREACFWSCCFCFLLCCFLITVMYYVLT